MNWPNRLPFESLLIVAIGALNWGIYHWVARPYILHQPIETYRQFPSESVPIVVALLLGHLMGRRGFSGPVSALGTKRAAYLTLAVALIYTFPLLLWLAGPFGGFEVMVCVLVGSAVVASVAYGISYVMRER